jgi:hypothetical protein
VPKAKPEPKVANAPAAAAPVAPVTMPAVDNGPVLVPAIIGAVAGIVLVAVELLVVLKFIQL